MHNVFDNAIIYEESKPIKKQLELDNFISSWLCV